MKCDELKVYVPQDGPWGLEPEEGGILVEEETCYLKSEVDAAIAELKAEIRRKEGVEQRWFERCMEERTENAELKKKLEDAGMRERRLKRALWLARAEMANESHFMWCQFIYDKKIWYSEVQRKKRMGRKRKARADVAYTSRMG